MPTAQSRPPGRARVSQLQDGLAQPGAMAKAFVVLEIVANSSEPITMADIVRATGLTKPTAHRITTALAEMGYIERDPLRKGYVEGPRLLALALGTLRAAAPRTVRHAILRSVSEQVGETCNFGVLVGSEVVYLDRVEAKWPLGLRFEAGSHVPAHCTAIGKLLLSQMPEPERTALISVLPLRRYTSRTLVDTRRLLEALDQIARTGVGTDDQEFMDGVVCVSVPVLGEDGLAIGGVAVSAPEARMTLAEAQALVPSMREAAAKIAATFALPGRDRAENRPAGRAKTRSRSPT